MKNINLILLFCIFFAPCLALLATFIANRKIHNKLLKKRRKRLIILFSTFLSLPLIVSAVFGLICGTLSDFLEFLEESYLSKTYISFFIFFVIFFLYAFFRKDNKTNSEIINNND